MLSLSEVTAGCLLQTIIPNIPYIWDNEQEKKRESIAQTERKIKKRVSKKDSIMHNQNIRKMKKKEERKEISGIG